MFLLFLWHCIQRVEDCSAQLRRIQAATDFASLHERNQTGFFRDDHRHRISVFSNTNRSAMPSPEISRESWIQRQRKKARSGGDAMASHNHSAIVQADSPC